MRGLAACILLLAVVACVPQDGTSARPLPLAADPAAAAALAVRNTPALDQPARGTPRVAGSGLTVRPAQGYCLDRADDGASARSAVILIGRCSGEGRVPPAVISVTVGPAGSARAMAAGGAALAGFVTSDAGRAALARDGREGSVRVAGAMSLGDAFVLRLEERGVGAYWRAVLALRDRLVTVTVMVTAGGEGLADDDGRSVLEATLTALRQANRASPAATGAGSPGSG